MPLQASRVVDRVDARRESDPVLWGTPHAFTLDLLAVVCNMTTKPRGGQAGTVVLLGFVVGEGSVVPFVGPGE